VKEIGVMNNKIVKNYLKHVIRIIGIVLFIMILARINLSQAFEIILDSNPVLVFFYVIVSVLVIFSIRAYKWKYLLNSQSIKISFFETLSLFFSSFFFASVTPGRLGEFIRIYYIKEKGHSTGKAAVSMFIDRIQDIVFLTILGILGALVLSSAFIDLAIIGSICLGVFIFLSVCFFISKKLRKMIYNSLFIILSGSLKKYFKTNIDDFFLDLKMTKSSVIAISSLLTVFAWSVFYLAFYLIAITMSIPISFFYVIICLSITSLVTLLPISISGVGTRDAAMILVFSQISLTSESAVAFSTVVLAHYLFPMLLGLFIWIFNPIKINKC